MYPGVMGLLGHKLIVEVSWNDSMCTVSRLDAEPAAAMAWKADPLGALKSLSAVCDPSGSLNCLWSISTSVSCGLPWPVLM